MKPIYICGLILVSAACGFISPFASGQSALDQTTLGKSQNDSRDLANSLVPAKQRFDKGEKKEEVDPRTLPTKTVKDTTFQGTLMDIGVDWTGDIKLQDKKAAGGSDKDAKTPNKTDAEKDSKASQQGDAAADKDSKGSKSTDARGDGQNKDQKAASAKSDGKAPEKEKASANKTDGNR